jgi:tRNA(Arg) A34 adenosine deaminase TadA
MEVLGRRIDVTRRSVLLAAIVCVATGCASRRACPPPGVHARVPVEVVAPARTAQDERDEVYALAAMAVVFKDWQSDTGKDSRGYNIGSVLVDPSGEVVAWGRNCNRRTGNGTQHGEIRLIQGYLAKRPLYYLKDHAVFTTLEPCAQCSGMMVLAKVARTVYCQTDPEFGQALDRLAYDSRTADGRGYAPYPRAVRSSRGAFAEAEALDRAYAAQAALPGAKSLVDWLSSPEARAIYARAVERLASFRSEFPENGRVVDRTRAFVATVPNRYVRIFPWDPEPAPAPIPVPAASSN